MEWFKFEGPVAVSALVLSVVATVTSIYFARINTQTEVLPTLVFVYDVQSGWSVKNVGRGPALDPEVAYREHGSDRWVKPTRLYPLGSGDRAPLSWVGANPDTIVIYYRDVHGSIYRSLVDDDRTTISESPQPKPWTRSDVLRQWER